MSAQDIMAIHPVVTLHQIRLLQKYTSVFQEATFERANEQFPSAFSLLAKTRQTWTGAAANARKSPIRETLHTFCKSIQQKLNRYFSLKSRRLNLSDTSTCS